MKRSISILWILALVAVASVGIAVTFSPETAKLQMFAGDSGDKK
jgi:hypothetical protein